MPTFIREICNLQSQIAATLSYRLLSPEAADPAQLRPSAWVTSAIHFNA